MSTRQFKPFLLSGHKKTDSFIYIKKTIRRVKTDNEPNKPCERLDCPTSRREYEIYGKKYIVTRHFNGESDINQLITELAFARADRETGIKKL